MYVVDVMRICRLVFESTWRLVVAWRPSGTGVLKSPLCWLKDVCCFLLTWFSWDEGRDTWLHSRKAVRCKYSSWPNFSPFKWRHRLVLNPDVLPRLITYPCLNFDAGLASKIPTYAFPNESHSIKSLGEWARMSKRLVSLCVTVGCKCRFHHTIATFIGIALHVAINHTCYVMETSYIGVRSFGYLVNKVDAIVFL